MTPPSETLGEIRGLSLWRPYPWSIVVGSKRLENRKWWWPRLKGTWIALHAAIHWDELGARRILQIHPEMPTGASDHPIGIVGVARIAGAVTEAQDPWFTGPYGWQLEEVTPIEPIRCKGGQRLWKLPKEILGAVRERFQATRKPVPQAPHDASADDRQMEMFP
jgi:hypothetical protein